MRDLTCRELIEFLMDYLDGELAPGERAAFDAHLADCPACIDYLESYRHTVRLGRSAFRELDAEIPEHVPAQLVDAVLTIRKRSCTSER